METLSSSRPSSPSASLSSSGSESLLSSARDEADATAARVTAPAFAQHRADLLARLGEARDAIERCSTLGSAACAGDAWELRGILADLLADDDRQNGHLRGLTQQLVIQSGLVNAVRQLKCLPASPPEVVCEAERLLDKWKALKIEECAVCYEALAPCVELACWHLLCLCCALRIAGGGREGGSCPICRAPLAACALVADPPGGEADTPPCCVTVVTALTEFRQLHVGTLTISSSALGWSTRDAFDVVEDGLRMHDEGGGRGPPPRAHVFLFDGRLARLGRWPVNWATRLPDTIDRGALLWFDRPAGGCGLPDYPAAWPFPKCEAGVRPPPRSPAVLPLLPPPPPAPPPVNHRLAACFCVSLTSVFVALVAVRLLLLYL